MGRLRAQRNSSTPSSHSYFSTPAVKANRKDSEQARAQYKIAKLAWGFGTGPGGGKTLSCTEGSRQYMMQTGRFPYMEKWDKAKFNSKIKGLGVSVRVALSQVCASLLSLFAIPQSLAKQ